MTAPATLGYPDYVRTYNSARTLLIPLTSETITTPHIFGPVAVGNIHSVGFQIASQINGAQIQIEWLLDAGGTLSVAFDHIDIRNGSFFSQTITVKSAFMRVTVSPVDATLTYSIIAWESPFDTITQDTVTANSLFALSGLAVAALTTTAIEASRIWAGPASITMFSTDGNNFVVLLESVNASGTARVLMRGDQAHPILGLPVYLPTCPVQVRLTNNDSAASHNFVALLTAKPLYP